jgi:hypothetical protein
MVQKYNSTYQSSQIIPHHHHPQRTTRFGTRSNLNLQFTCVCSSIPTASQRAYIPCHTRIHAYTAKSKVYMHLPDLHPHHHHLHHTTPPIYPSAYPQRDCEPCLSRPADKTSSTQVTRRILAENTCKQHAMQCSMQEPMQGPRSKTFASAAERAQLLLSVCGVEQMSR